jgi:hypothetical protein
VSAKAEKVQTALRAEQLGQPPVVAAAHAATVRVQVAILTTLQTQIKRCKSRCRRILGSTRGR